MKAFGPPYDPILATNASGYPVIRFVGTNGSAFNFLEAADSPSLGNYQQHDHFCRCQLRYTHRRDERRDRFQGSMSTIESAESV